MNIEHSRVAVTLPTIKPADSLPVGDVVWLMPAGFSFGIWEKGFAAGSANGSQLS